ncbi:MAG: multicopper oxidase domain-containing protein [Bacteroidetes bacterium]|jgi:blue copper oxidase|nr:multicopper oxidase domain-containing protein [Bacteroidota bacterium]MBL0280681.1 multicopper oxidase domain-containing protein [Bacteroidota bacterium]MBP9879806.1 multicopper oxidase domain-containing protein [Chitinophagales bacterium]
MKKQFLIANFFLCMAVYACSQNPLTIPPAITGTAFNLNVQNGTTQFFDGINTPTYGINGDILGPTIIVNKWDWVTLNVTNSLTGTGNSTTMHWHGLHVPAMADGGPHQIIEQGATWSPQFQILNNASTFWYHPHGLGKTDLQVARGLAGFFIIKDSAEAAINLPRSYGIDDFPIVVQTKAFDILYQVAIATQDDTLVCVNATVDPFLNAPAQVVRLRLLNGSSMRVYNFGFTNDKEFNLIGTDGGLLNNSLPMNRLLLAPGERGEILLDLQGMEGQTIYLMSNSSEMVNGIYGAATVTGMMGGEIPDYNLNPLNGADFEILQINVVAQTADPVLTIPDVLVANEPLITYDNTRTFNLQPDVMMDPEGQVMGPFNINGEHFDMEVINETLYINDVEKWRIQNNTGIAHPFHIHDIQFNIDNINGGPVPLHLQGLKDVVLVMPMSYVEVIAKFEDFADDEVPYMYHCHMLHHEDDGMMGSFLVVDTTKNSIQSQLFSNWIIYPNPVIDFITVQTITMESNVEYKIFNDIGEKVISSQKNNTNNIEINVSQLPAGAYLIQLKSSGNQLTKYFVKL